MKLTLASRIEKDNLKRLQRPPDSVPNSVDIRHLRYVEQVNDADLSYSSIQNSASATIQDTNHDRLYPPHLLFSLTPIRIHRHSSPGSFQRHPRIRKDPAHFIARVLSPYQISILTPAKTDGPQRRNESRISNFRNFRSGGESPSLFILLKKAHRRGKGRRRSAGCETNWF